MKHKFYYFSNIYFDEKTLLLGLKITTPDSYLTAFVILRQEKTKKISAFDAENLNEVS